MSAPPIESFATRTTGDGSPLWECERVLAEHDALHRCVSIEPRRDEAQDADVRLLFAERAWLLSPAGEQALAALRRHPSIAGVQRRRSAVLVRFEDGVLARLERRLSAGELADMAGADILHGRRFTVGFVGPNTNKALHVGHLRNIVLGQALASALASAGATVQRHSLVGDIGRRVCEAMGGYLTCHDGESPRTTGLAGDRFVELCSRDYPRRRAATTGGGTAGATAGRTAGATVGATVGDPNAEESETRGDLADTIMNAWLLGAAPERALWWRMRDWALTGQLYTLARLGVWMDRYDFESEGIQRAHELIARGLRTGLFEREPTGAVIHRTGRSEYTTMVLLRADGAPTEYARLLGVYHRMLEALHPGAEYLELAGIEWQPPTAVLGELLGALSEPGRDERYGWLLHGSVTVGGQKMGSSTGEVMWIDDLLDAVAAGPGVDGLHELADGAVGREQLADIVIRGAFLCAPTTQPFAFSLDQLLQGPTGPGWTIARAWCRAQRRLQPSAATPAARTAIVQSQLYRWSLRRTVQQRDTASLSNYLLGLSEACLAAPTPGPAAAAILSVAMRSLGFLIETDSAHQPDRAGMHHALDRQPVDGHSQRQPNAHEAAAVP
jgi:arginyl-tRNA synthetase